MLVLAMISFFLFSIPYRNKILGTIIITCQTSLYKYQLISQFLLIIWANKLQIKGMLKILFTLLLIALATAREYQQAQIWIERIKQKKQRIVELENLLRKAQKRLKECQSNSIGKIGTDTIEDRSLTDRLRSKVRQLQDQVKSLLEKASSKIDDEDSLIYKFKLRIEDLEKKFKGEVDRSEGLISQRSLLQRKIDEYKFKAQQFTNKIKELTQESLRKGKIHLEDIDRLKQDYEGRIKNAINNKCDSLSNEIVRKEEQCKREAKTYGQRIKDLEQAAVNKAREFADKVTSTKNEVVTRIKNFLTGRGPYNKQEQEAFSEFKLKVSNLEDKIKQRLTDIDRIKRQKEDADFQQRYCRAQLSDYDREISELEKEAASTGKRYFVDQIKKLAQQRVNNKPSQTNDEIYKSFQEKISMSQDKIRKQLQQNERLYRERRAAEEKTQQCQDQLQKMRIRAENSQSDGIKIKSKYQEVLKLLKQIYALKEK